MTSPTQRVIIIGGGITALSAACRIAERSPKTEIRLLEATSRLGGVLETVKQDGFLIERSADNFITNVPWAIDFCRSIGLEEELIPTNDADRRAFVLCRGRLEPIPPGFLVMAPSQIGPILKTPILSWSAKLRLAGEYFVRARAGEDESLASFATRRLGRETYERLVQPLVGGIYTADPDRLSIRAAMPRFHEMEQTHGSLIRAMRHEARQKNTKNQTHSANDESESGARYTMFTAPRDGVSSMIAAAAARLPADSVRLETRVEEIQQQADSSWQVEARSTAEAKPQSFSADALILATPSRHAAEIVSSADPTLAAELRKIEGASCSVVSLGYRRDQIEHPLDGFGFVVPRIENRKILSASFSSRKYPGRAPEGCELIRVFIGGACQAELADLPDDQLVEIATSEMAELIGAKGKPLFHLICRWQRTMPQYHLGHNDLVERIETRVGKLAHFALAGNAYHGVGIPQCIQSGQQAADQTIKELDSAKNT